MQGVWNTTYSQSWRLILTPIATCVNVLKMSLSLLKWLMHYWDLTLILRRATANEPNTEQKVISLTVGNSGAWEVQHQPEPCPVGNVFPKQKPQSSRW